MRRVPCSAPRLPGDAGDWPRPAHDLRRPLPARPRLQGEIEEGLNVVEAWTAANAVLYYGKGGEIATNRREEVEMATLCLRILQASLVYVNTLMLQDILAEPQSSAGDFTNWVWGLRVIGGGKWPARQLAVEHGTEGVEGERQHLRVGVAGEAESEVEGEIEVAEEGVGQGEREGVVKGADEVGDGVEDVGGFEGEATDQGFVEALSMFESTVEVEVVGCSPARVARSPASATPHSGR
ncbi:Tn3 family transposase [Streptomyces mirabilis]|uniref:Tn3 family transposase n=1 Tax=Streptomyces mirabilis TaxID=68239 RepID=UPI0036A827E6